MTIERMMIEFQGSSCREASAGQTYVEAAAGGCPGDNRGSNSNCQGNQVTE